MLLGVVFLSLCLPQSVISLRAHPLSIPKDSFIFIIILSRHMFYFCIHTARPLPGPLSVHSFLNKKRSIAWCMILSFSLFPPFLFFPLSLFSLFSVQHPGIKILRSDSSSSISSRIGWISPLSLTLSLSRLYFLRLVCFWLFFCVPLGFHLSFFSSSSFFFCCSYLYRSTTSPFSSSSLVWWFGLVAVPCWLWSPD